MSIIHFSTELSGGAGGFVNHLHQAMLDGGLSSKVITRQPNEVREAYVVKPMGRLKASLRSWVLEAKSRLGFLDTSYAMFGIEPDVLDIESIANVLQGCTPQAFIFYWISYFVSFETIAKLRDVYPGVPIIFMLTDEAFLTGGCHYSHGCLGYESSCSDCPAVALKSWKKRVERGFVHRSKLIRAMDPLVIYPTTNIKEMGQRSGIMKTARSSVLPLGVISKDEKNAVIQKRGLRRNKKENGGKLSLLVRSSSEHRKGCDLFVEALLMLQRQHPDLCAKLQVVSVGDDALVKAGIDRYVEHQSMGLVSRAQLLSLYGDVDAFFMTSREEGGPLMTNECVALGIFVISTPVGVTKDLITNGVNGLITADISSQSMSHALAELLSKQHPTNDNSIEEKKLDQIKKTLTFEGYIQALTDVIASEVQYEQNRIP